MKRIQVEYFQDRATYGYVGRTVNRASYVILCFSILWENFSIFGFSVILQVSTVSEKVMFYDV